MSCTVFSRRHAAALLGVAVAFPLVFIAATAWAADPLTVGVLLPGSRSDKGWMESAYDGLKAAEKKHGDKIKVQLIENVSNADWEQAFNALAQKNQLVIGAAGQVQTVEMKVAKRFPKVKFSLIGGNKTADMPPNFAGYDVKQAEIAYVAGVAAAPSATSAASWCRRSSTPAPSSRTARCR
jgi:basic membrane protein A